MLFALIESFILPGPFVNHGKLREWAEEQHLLRSNLERETQLFISGRITTGPTVTDPHHPITQDIRLKDQELPLLGHQKHQTRNQIIRMAWSSMRKRAARVQRTPRRTRIARTQRSQAAEKRPSKTKRRKKTKMKLEPQKHQNRQIHPVPN